MRNRAAILSDISASELRLKQLKQELEAAESSGKLTNSVAQSPTFVTDQVTSTHKTRWPLPAEDYKRYGRQMIMPEIGLHGQLKLRKSSVLIVGLGGLGCPAAAYLAGAGISRLGLIDGDTVEISNLHRQILHTSDRVGLHKVHSAIESLRLLNPGVSYEPYTNHITPQTALDIFSKYDLILDCTDHPTSRYLISDAAVLSGKPLVSASALKTDGQLVVLNYPPTAPQSDAETTGFQSPPVPPSGGPCYRCIFPKPPPSDSVISCGEGGILGPVVGTMGVLMALEALKIFTAISQPEPGAPTYLHLFQAYPATSLRSMRMKGKRPGCIACGETRTITAASLSSGSLDYIAFCGVTNPVRILEDSERVSAADLAQSQKGLAPSSLMGGQRPTVIDVRDKTQFELASLPDSINIPFSQFGSGNPRLIDTLDPHSPLVVVCRLGNDSQIAARQMKLSGYADNGRWIGDLRGGLAAWRKEMEPNWPDY